MMELVMDIYLLKIIHYTLGMIQVFVPKRFHLIKKVNLMVLVIVLRIYIIILKIKY